MKALRLYTQKKKSVFKEQVKSKKVITLVALVVTIVVLILLAGVSINLVIGNNGIMQKAKEAKENIAEKAKTAYNIAIAVLAVAIFVCSLRHTEEGKQSYG